MMVIDRQKNVLRREHVAQVGLSPALAGTHEIIEPSVGSIGSTDIYTISKIPRKGEREAPKTAGKTFPRNPVLSALRALGPIIAGSSPSVGLNRSYAPALAQTGRITALAHPPIFAPIHHRTDTKSAGKPPTAQASR